MTFEWLLTRDPATRLRLVRQLMGLGSYLMFLAPGALAVEGGHTHFGYRGLFALWAVAVAVNLGFFIAIRTGFSRRFAEPSLLFPQLVTALVLAVITIHHMESEARSIMLMLFVALFFFGIFGLTIRQFLALAVTAIAGYSGLMAYEFHDRPLDSDAFGMELLRLVAVAMITLWMSMVGGYFARLRQKLAQRKVELTAALARVKDLSERDELTGAHNRRHLMQALDIEKARADRFGLPFSVAIIDLDHFKRFNDGYGHHVGDEVLQGFCNLVREQARELDVVARHDMDEAFGRYGGEEFLLVLPHTGVDGAEQCLQRIRQRVEHAAFATSAGPLSATFSAGVAQYRPGESITDLLSRADAALYEAKSAGRNRVFVA